MQLDKHNARRRRKAEQQLKRKPVSDLPMSAAREIEATWYSEEGHAYGICGGQECSASPSMANLDRCSSPEAAAATSLKGVGPSPPPASYAAEGGSGSSSASAGDDDASRLLSTLMQNPGQLDALRRLLGVPPAHPALLPAPAFGPLIRPYSPTGHHDAPFQGDKRSPTHGFDLDLLSCDVLPPLSPIGLQVSDASNLGMPQVPPSPLPRRTSQHWPCQ